MADEGKYDAPRVGDYGDLDMEEETLQDKLMGYGRQGGDILRTNMKLVVIVIVVLAAGYFALDFFVFSQTSVNISIVDTEGNIIPDAGIRVYAAGDPTPIDQFIGGKTITYRRGTSLTADVAVVGFKSKSRAPIAGADTATIEMERDMDLELIVDGMPGSLVPGEERVIFVTLTNNGTKPADVDLVFEDDFGNKYMEGVFTKVTLARGGFTDTTAMLKVKSDADKRTGLKGVIRVKGLNNSDAKKTFNFDIIEFEDSKIKASPSRKIDFGKVDGGTPNESKKITLSNSHKEFVLTDITFEVVDIRATANDPDDVLNWFEFSPPTIPSLSPGTSGKEFTNLILNVPSTAESDVILGKIVISNPFWDIPLDLELEVEAVSFALSIQGVGLNYILGEADGGGWQEETDRISLSNRGDATLRNVKVQVASPCEGNFVSFSTTDFPAVLPGEAVSFFMILNAPITQNEDDIMICKIRVTYDDPTGLIDKKEIVKEFQITTR